MDIEGLDEGIRPAVEVLNQNGFLTYESCEGGLGHCYPEPTVRFYGDEFDLIRAYSILELYGFCLSEAKRVYRKTCHQEGETLVGHVWDKPTNEIVFLRHSKTGTIFCPKR